MKHRIIALLTGLCAAALPFGTGTVTSFFTSAAEADTEPVRILAMGDSITDGYINGDNGYRKYLCYQLQQHGFTNFDMVGPNNSWSDSVSYTTADGVTFQYDPAHAGFSGYAIQAYSGRQGLYETVFDTTYFNGNISGNMMEAYDPDIVLLQIGTNDLLDNHNEGVADRLEKMVDSLLDHMNNTDMLFVASVPDIDVSVRYDWLWAYQSSGLSYETDPEAFTALVQKSVDDYNDSVQKLVAEKQAEGKRIRFADINSTVDMKTGLEDGVHPNESGYACMGEYWSEQVLAYLNDTDSTPTTTTTSAGTTETTTETTASPESSDTAESTTTTIDTWEKGDVDLNGTVELSDAVLLCRYLLAEDKLSYTAYLCADLTEDGIVNGMDLTMLRQRLVQTGGQ